MIWKRDTTEYPSFLEFQKLGYFLGGILPILIFLIIQIPTANNFANVEQSGMMLVLVVALVAMALGIWILLLGERHYGGKLFSALFSTQAFFSCLLIHLLVLYTGSPRASVFSFFYLYMPAIVGYTYGRGSNLIIAAVVLAASYITNLFFAEFQKNSFWFPLASCFHGSIKSESAVNDCFDRLYFLLIFLLQLGVTVTIASRQSLAKRRANDGVVDGKHD